MRGLEEHEQVSELFRTLGSPVRVALVSLLTDAELCVHELVDALELPQPLVSQHLRVLREAGLVTRTRRGREVAYVLSDDHVAHIVSDARSHSHEVAAGTPRPTADDGPHEIRRSVRHGAGHDGVAADRDASGHEGTA